MNIIVVEVNFKKSQKRDLSKAYVSLKNRSAAKIRFKNVHFLSKYYYLSIEGYEHFFC